MTRQFSFALLAGSLMLAAPAAASAQQESVPRVGACFYEDADYRGNYFCATPGEDRGSMRGMNDRISSIRVFGGAEVEVFSDNNFNGGARRINRNIPNLGNAGWNDQISSFRVRDSRSGSGRQYYNDNGQYGNQYGRDNPDRIVRRAYQDILNRDPDAEGMRVYRGKIIDEGWTEAQVRDALRASPEYRGSTARDGRERITGSRGQAQEIVRRAYLNVLQREPDPAAATWVDRVVNDHWTQQDVERELRKSEEYRRKR